MGETEEESSFLQYLDVNNLLGWDMSQKLSTGGFNCVDASEFMSDKTDSFADCNSGGYLLEVDTKYPKELHELHNDLPFMCEKMVISKVEKLLPKLHDKKNHVIHMRALDQALKHGLILVKVHCVIEFDQSAWLAPYINFNTELRTKAENDFEKELINNSVFGKAIEIVRKRKDVELVTNKKAYLIKVMKSNFKSEILFSENLMPRDASECQKSLSEK